MRSPFKFLDAYSRKDKDAFFGRKEETDLFYEMVNKNRLVLVYGQSGSGKTSLVECGLANRFDVTDWYPIRVRRRQNLNESLQESLHSILKATEEEGIPLPTDLVDQVEEIYAEYLRPVYLIFDQLEEAFILGDKTEQTTFIQNIDHLYYSNIPCRIIFILREEYLGHLYNFEKVIPTLFDRRLRVEAINNTKIKEVLVKSFAKFNITLEAPAEDRLAEMVANICGEKTLVQLPYLQVYLDMLYREDYQRTYGDKERGEELPPLEFTQAEIQEFGQIDEVLSKFLDFQEKEIQRILYQKHTFILDNTVLQIMDAFVTDEGTKRPLAYTRTDNLIKVDERVRRLFPPVTDEILSDCFWELDKARIIRGSDNYMELAHDSLAALLTKKRGAEQQVRKRLAATLQEYELSGGQQLLTETQLLGMAEILPSLYLDEATHAFIEKSKKAIATAKAAEKAAAAKELAEQKQRAEEERRLRYRAERNSTIAKNRTKTAAVVSLLALIGFIVAGYNFIKAKNAAQTAKLQIRQNWANEIAYKAGDLLKEGRRSSAFQLASFTNRFVAKDYNAEAAEVISDAYYYNDFTTNPQAPPLSWSRTFHGHRGAITAIATSKDGRYILTGSEDRTVKLWLADSSKVIRTFRGHTGEITALAFSPNGQYYLSGSRDQTVKLWHQTQDQELYTATKKYRSVTAFAFAPDGQSLLVTNDTTATLWSFSVKEAFDQKAPLATFKGHQKEITSIAFAPSGQYVLTGGKDQKVNVWSVNPISLIESEQVGSTVLSLAFTKAEDAILIGSVDNITQWTFRNGQKRQAATFAHKTPVSALAFLPDSNLVLTTTAINNQHHRCQLWDLSNPTKNIATFTDHSAPVTVLAFSNGGESILTGSKDFSIKLWKRNPQKKTIDLANNQSQVLAVAATADGGKLALGYADATIHLLNKAEGSRKILKGHQGWVHALAFSPDNRFLISTSKDSTAILWEVATGNNLRTFKQKTGWINDVAFDPDGKMVLMGNQDNTALLWKDFAQKQKPVILEGHQHPVTAVAFSPDGSTLVTSGFDGKVILRKTKDIFSSDTLFVKNEVSALAFSPDGNYLVIGCTGNNTAKLWELATKKQIGTFEGHTDWITSVAYLPKKGEDYVLTASRDNTIRLWESRRGREIRRFREHRAAITDIAIYQDTSMMILSSSKDSTTKEWMFSPNAIHHQQQDDYSLGFLNIVEFLGEYGITDMIENFPEAWPYFLNHANHLELQSIGDFMFSEVTNNNNPAIYNRQYTLAEQCYQQTIKSSDWVMYREQLAHMYFKWSQNLQESGLSEKALAKAEVAFKYHPTFEHFENVYTLLANPSHSFFDHFKSANQLNQSIQEKQTNLFQQFSQKATSFDLRQGKAYFQGFAHYDARKLDQLAAVLARKQQQLQNFKQALPASYADIPLNFSATDLPKNPLALTPQKVMVSIGVFQRKTYAQRLVLQAAKYGHKAIVQPISNKGKRLFRVSIPCQFENEQAFQQVLQRLQLQFEEVEVIRN